MDMRRLWSNRSWSRSQINVDMLIAYLLFIFFFAFTVEFSLGLVDPFSNAMERSKENMLMERVMRSLEGGVYYGNITYLCNVSGARKVWMKVKTLMIDASQWDGEYVNETGLIIRRKGNELILMINNMSTAVGLVFPEEMAATWTFVANESSDVMTFMKDEFGNDVFQVKFGGENDYDEVRFDFQSPGFVTLFQIPDLTYIGDRNATIYCGEDIGGYSASMSGYTKLVSGGEESLATFEVKVWW